MAFEGFREIGLVCRFFYVAATALRLARFNILAQKRITVFLWIALSSCSNACCDLHLDSY